MFRLFDCLEQGVSREGVARFLHFNRLGKVSQRFQLEAVRLKQFGQLAQLFAVAGAEDEEAGHERKSSEVGGQKSEIGRRQNITTADSCSSCPLAPVPSPPTLPYRSSEFVALYAAAIDCRGTSTGSGCGSMRMPLITRAYTSIWFVPGLACSTGP